MCTIYPSWISEQPCRHGSRPFFTTSLIDDGEWSPVVGYSTEPRSSAARWLPTPDVFISRKWTGPQFLWAAPAGLGFGDSRRWSYGGADARALGLQAKGAGNPEAQPRLLLIPLMVRTSLTFCICLWQSSSPQPLLEAVMRHLSRFHGSETAIRAEWYIYLPAWGRGVGRHFRLTCCNDDYSGEW